MGPVLAGIVEVGERIGTPFTAPMSRRPYAYQPVEIVARVEASVGPAMAQGSEHPLRFAIIDRPFHRLGDRDGRFNGDDRWGRADPPKRRRGPQEPHALPRGSKLEIDKIIWIRDTPHTGERREGRRDGHSVNSRYPC